MLRGFLLGSLLGKGHDRRAQAFLVDSVHGGVDGREAAELFQEGVRQFLQGVSEMGHIAAGDGGVALPGAGHRHHRGVLEKVVIAAKEVSLAIGLSGLERGAVLSLVVSHLGALDLQGKSFPDPPDHIVQQFGVLVNVHLDDLVQVVRGLVFHPVEVRVAVHGGDGADAGNLSAPDAPDGETDCGKDADNPKENFLHDGQYLTAKLHIFPIICTYLITQKRQDLRTRTMKREGI